MPSQQAQPGELLRRANDAPAGSTERKLLVAAAFGEAALADAVLVGGTAVELHTGSYRPTDIDLVGHTREGYAARLDDLEFVREGRHWLIALTNGETLAVEVPGDRLGDFAVEPPRTIELSPGRIDVISLNDLMMDRLLQATGGEPVTMDEAVRLAVAAYERIDWDGLAARAASAGQEATLAGAALPSILTAVRRTALKHLRR